MHTVSSRVVSALLLSAGIALGGVQFNRDIRPLLSDNCFACHGPDPGSRKAGLRLDTREGFFEKTEKRGATVLPGNPAESPLFQRLTNPDPEEVMPPPEAHKELKPEQTALIRQWIAEGAPWQPHWAFIKPERPAVPQVKQGGWVRNPVDAFILRDLEAKGLAPAPEADRRTLARRLVLDLTGLPPEPAEVDALVSDAAPDAYEKFVAAQMAKPQWGEHRGRYWLDAARYADTHGLHFDNYREIWPYRDWVINAFNRNQPFDQFTREQLAGDLLPNPTLDQLVATGFHRCNITTNEGGTIPEENLVGYARERTETTSWVWLGLTANCAVCHDHKFDPVTAKDFYAMSAFFRNTTQAALDGNVKDTAPVLQVPAMGEDRLRWAQIDRELTDAKTAFETVKKTAAKDFDAWTAAAKPENLEEHLSQQDLVTRVPLNEGAGEEVRAACSSPATFKATGQVLWKPDGKIGPAPVMKTGATFDLGNLCDFEKTQAFSYGAWVRPGKAGVFGGILARMDQGNDYRGWDLFQDGRNYAMHLVSKWPSDAIKVTTTKNPIKEGRWQHVFVTYDGSERAEGVRIFVDGTAMETKVESNNLRNSIRTTVPLRIGQRSKDQVFEDGAVQDVRVYSRLLQPAEIKTLAGLSTAQSILAAAREQRTPQQREALFHFFLTAVHEPSRQSSTRIAALEKEQSTLRSRSPIAYVQKENPDGIPSAAVLFRGQYDQPREKVTAGTFAALHPFPQDAPHNRLGLAEWILSPDNPLTARVTVNRFWQEVFGVGIVRTSEDFGIMGEPPSNQDLLDWLAEEFRESKWDVKRLFTLLVTSSTYRQSACTTPDKLEKDPANRLLSRGPRFRMDAEMVRDYALKASGLLIPKIGGPSVKPYQPDGVWEAVAMPESNTRRYQRDTGENLYRRSLYTFWKRAAPPASMDIFNATARETSCLRRERTNTPLQALVTMNDVQFVEAARVLAQKALLAAPSDMDAGLQFVAARILCRPFLPEELNVVRETLDQHLAAYRAAPEEAGKLIAYGESKPDAALDPTVLAAWTMAVNQVMNLDETLNK